MLLRSRSSKRRIIKKEDTKTLCPKKRAKPPPRVIAPKKIICTRNKSPGFSDDDDMPLKKITLNTSKLNTKLTKEPEKDDVPQSLQLDVKKLKNSSKKIKLKRVKEENNTNDSNKQIAKELETDDLPLGKIIQTNRSIKTTKEPENDDVHVIKINNDQEFDRDDVPLKITRTNKIKTKQTKDLKSDDLPLIKLNDIKSSYNICSKNGKVTNEVNDIIDVTNKDEKDDIPLSKIAPINKSKSKMKTLENINKTVDKDDVNKFCTLRSAAARTLGKTRTFDF